MADGKRFQRSMTFQGTEFPKEADVHKAIELTVSRHFIQTANRAGIGKQVVVSVFNKQRETAEAAGARLQSDAIPFKAHNSSPDVSDLTVTAVARLLRAHGR
jgi:hypothetical protein